MCVVQDKHYIQSVGYITFIVSPLPADHTRGLILNSVVRGECSTVPVISRVELDNLQVGKEKITVYKNSNTKDIKFTLKNNSWVSDEYFSFFFFNLEYMCVIFNCRRHCVRSSRQKTHITFLEGSNFSPVLSAFFLTTTCERIYTCISMGNLKLRDGNLKRVPTPTEKISRGPRHRALRVSTSYGFTFE